jgi:hypothetical protein
MVLGTVASRRFERSVGLSLWRDAKARREAAEIAPYLDATFYLETNADVAEAGIDASFHYAKYGWREGRDPSPGFSTKGYLAAHPKVALSGVNPLLHFIHASASGATPPVREEGPCPESVLALVEEHLDAAFYAAHLTDALPPGMSAAAHYCRTGWRRGLDPAPDFSTSYYLMTNPDVRDRGINPYWHYLIAGKDEGRLPLHPGGWRHGILSRQTSFEAYCDEWLREDPQPDLLTADALAGRLADMRQCPGLLISVGHDDYRRCPGGVQLCVELEEVSSISKGRDYLNIHPWQPLPRLADAENDTVLSLVLNGATVGSANASTLCEAMASAVDAGSVEMVIHHLAGHAPEQVLSLARRLGIARAHFWLHDYFTLCTSYTLQRNNVAQCDAPEATSNACRICLFGQERARQVARMETLFDALEITVVAPSQSALAFWRARSALRPAATVVHPHVLLTPSGGGAAPAVTDDAPVRIAFVGTPAPHKGWPVFTELQRRLLAADGYEFWFFGADPPGQAKIRHVPTHVKADAPDSTARAIAENRIDLVLHWASWRETFSFSTYEALGGGAFVLTNPGSGNVAAAVTELDRGVVLETPEALYDLARSGGLKVLAQRARQARQQDWLDMQFSGMTFDLLEAGAIT